LGQTNPRNEHCSNEQNSNSQPPAIFHTSKMRRI